MTKISNQRAYIPDEEINGLDYLPGTDFDQALKTVNFRVQDLGTHYNQVNGVRNFDYNFYAHNGSNPKPADGYFYSNSNEQEPNNITYFIFSKKTARLKDTTNFFESISAENPFDLIIAQKVDINTIFFFRIDSIETFSGYYKLNVSEVFFPNGKELSYTLSYAVFNLKSEGGPTVTKTSDLINDGEDGINPFITLQDLPTPPIIPIKTSDLTNDGEDGTSTYVEADELGVVAFSNDYNDLDNKPTIPTPISNHSELSLDDGTNPHGTTKSDVGLGSVDNTSDVDKPISTATQNALDSKIDKVSTAGVERTYIINADGSQGIKATADFGGGILACQRFQGAGISPADNTYYNIGGSNNTTPLAVPMGNYTIARIIKALATGNITKVLVSFTGGSGTGETSTIKIKNVTQTTDVTVTTTLTTNQSVNAQVVNVSLAVTQGDELILEWLTPTYATNPTGIVSYCEFTIE